MEYVDSLSTGSLIDQTETTLFVVLDEIDNNSHNNANYCNYCQNDKWKNVDEEYFLFPSSKAEEKHRDDASAFSNFKDDVEEYFPNYNGVIGKAFYVNEEMKKLTISIDMQFYSKSEVLGFTQYVAGLVMDYFPDYLEVETKISSSNGQESLIVKEVDDKEPYVYIYNE